MTTPLPLKPRRLKPGDTVGVVAPSSPFEKEALDKGLSVIHNLGLKTRLAEELFDRKGYLAGSDGRRLAQLMRMFTDKDIDAVLCARGGFGSLKLLIGVDYHAIANHPKAFVGFSDITALHQAFFQQIGLVTFHGPMATTLAEADECSLEAWQMALMETRPIRLTSRHAQTIVGGVAQGVVTGGNLATLCHLVGTAFSPRFQGAILALEETNEPLYRIDRMLTQMTLAGCFHGLAGVAVGDFNGCGPPGDMLNLMRDCFAPLSIPVAAGFPWGHTRCNLTLPLGLPARLDADAGEITFLEAATSP
jgi:muramoyltetrapeptide carboxypeptidase